jgi:hypothetical protein
MKKFLSIEAAVAEFKQQARRAIRNGNRTRAKQLFYLVRKRTVDVRAANPERQIVAKAAMCEARMG